MNSLLRPTRLFLILFIILPLLPQAAPAQEKKPVLLMDAFGNRDFYAMGIPGMQWMNDGTRYAFSKRNSETGAMDIYTASAASGEEKLFLETGALKTAGGERFSYEEYAFSPDEKHILFTVEQHQIWRHSFTADYIIYDLETKQFISLPAHAEGLRNVKFSPDGKKIGYVLNDDIYVFEFASGKETRLTSDAQEHIFNGRFGWVYEEEFGIIDGWRWSPDGKRIAFWQEDERPVPEFTMTDWMPSRQELIPIRYPKVGDPNPIMKIGVIDGQTKAVKWMDIGTETDIYIPRIYWTNDPNKLCIIRMNRLQNKVDVLMADAATGKSAVVLAESSSTGWIEIEDDFLRFLKKSNTFIWASERTGWKHLYQYDYSGKLVAAVTSGNWEVASVEGITPDEKYLYFTSTEVSPVERHLYKTAIGSGKNTKLTEDAGTHSIDMSPTCAAYLDSWSSIEAPAKIAFFDGDGDELRVVKEISKSVYEPYHWQPKEIGTFTTSDGLELYYSIVKPANFDPAKKYPVYVDIYGGPGYQSVANRWPSPMFEWIASNGFVHVQVNNRGSGGQGTDFKHRVYKVLGKWEAFDFVELAKFLGTLPYVDTDNIGIWGWSYGGYMSALTMLLGADYYKAAVAIAPVTDWKLYDTIYGERYMQRPSDNPDGYKVGSCIEHADKLKGGLLIIHGGQDDNVHVQNTMQFIDALESAGKDFDMRIYPNGNHGVVTSMQQRFGLYEYFMDFLKNKLQ